MALFASAHTATGQTRASSLSLQWEAPAECPDQARVLAQVEALLGDAAGTTRALEARARVTQAVDGGFVLSLQLYSENSVEQRDLVGDSCQALVDSVAVMLSLQLQPTSAPAAEPAPPPAVVERAPEQPPSPPARTSWLQLGIGGAGDSAALPRFALGARLDLGYRQRRWYVGVSGAGWLPQEQALREGHAGRARFEWLAGALTLCHASWGEGVRLGPCLALEAGRLTAESRAVRVPGRVGELWLAAHGGLAFWIPLGSRFLLHSSLIAVAPLRRPELVVEGIGQIHQPRALGARSSLGLAACF